MAALALMTIKIIILTRHNFLSHHRPAIRAENKITKHAESFVILLSARIAGLWWLRKLWGVRIIDRDTKLRKITRSPKQARIQGRWNGWIFTPPPFFLSPLSYPSNTSTRLWFYYIITKVHPPFQNPGSVPAKAPHHEMLGAQQSPKGKS